MKLCIDLCHPTQNESPTERPPCPAAPAKASPAARHRTNDLPARRPLPTRPSTFSPVRSCRLPTTRQASAAARLGRAGKSSPQRTATSARQSACSKSSRSPAFGLRHYVTPAPPRPHLRAAPNRRPKSRGATPPNPSHRMHLRCVQNGSKAVLLIVCQLLALYTVCIQNTGLSHANASQTVSKPCLHPARGSKATHKGGVLRLVGAVRRGCKMFTSAGQRGLQCRVPAAVRFSPGRLALFGRSRGRSLSILSKSRPPSGSRAVRRAVATQSLAVQPSVASR